LHVHRMRKGVFLLLALAVLPLLLSGCYLNLFQTAKTLDQGRVLFGLGVGMTFIEVEADTVVSMVAPQGQLGIGLADGLQLTLQTGFLAALGGELQFTFAGASGEFKFRLFDEPGAFALALGFGGGWGFNYYGWAIHGTAYFDSNAPLLPLYFVWRPFVSFGELEDGDILFGHQFAGGFRLTLSELATFLLEVDFHSLWQLWSPGIALLLTF